MEWINIIVSSLCALIGAVGGGSILYFSQNKRKKDIENELKEADAWEKMYHEKENKVDKKDSKIDELRRHINQLQNERLSIEREHFQAMLDKEIEIHKLQLLNEEYKWNECKVNGCLNRQPPRKREQIKTNDINS